PCPAVRAASCAAARRSSRVRRWAWQRVYRPVPAPASSFALTERRRTPYIPGMRNPWVGLVLLSTVAAVSSPSARAAEDLHAQGGIGLIAVTTNSASGALLVLEDAQHDQVDSGTTDRFGSLVFRYLTPGAYVVRDLASGESAQATVLAFDDLPDP